MPDLSASTSTLIVKSSQGNTKEIEIASRAFAIGRKSDNDLTLDDPSVSGHHAKIVKIQEVWFLEDLASTNGTFVNEHKIERKQLQVRMSFELEPTASFIDTTMSISPDHRLSRSRLTKRIIRSSVQDHCPQRSRTPRHSWGRLKYCRAKPTSLNTR